MKNLMTREGFFDMFTKKQKEDPRGEPITRNDSIESITVDGNPYYASIQGNRILVYKGGGDFGGTPTAYIFKLDDGNFLLRHSTDKGIKKVKIPTIERGLQYLKEDDDRKFKEGEKPDIDLT